MFSKACEYGIRAATYIALRSLEDRRVSLREIASEIDSPIAYTAKILQQLARNNIVTSVKGASGGFEIPKEDVSRIDLSRIVKAMDGDDVYLACGLGLKQCNAKIPCPVHEKFVIVRNNLRDMLDNTSLYEMTRGLESGATCLKRHTISKSN